LYISGQLGLEPKSMQLHNGLEAQTDQVMKNLGAILEAGGSNWNKVVKTTILLKDINDFSKVNSIYAKYFTADPPARATYAVSALPKDALIEIEAVAVVD